MTLHAFYFVFCKSKLPSLKTHTSTWIYITVHEIKLTLTTKHNNSKKIVENKQTEETFNEEIIIDFK